MAPGGEPTHVVMRVLAAVCFVALAWGCAPTIIAERGSDPSHPEGSGASTGQGGNGEGAASGTAGGPQATGGAGGSSSSSSSTAGAGAAGGLGPTPASCAAAAQGGSLFGAACAYAPCSAAHAPPAMIPITAGNGTSYCMDTRTVSAGEYKAFLAAQIDPSQQPSRCLWNTSFEPGAGSSGCDSFDPVNAPDADVTCVDLCDAEAYCLWAGKRLCGRIGGGDIDYVDDGKPSIDQFTFACQSHALPFVEHPAAKVFEWEPVCETELSAESLCNVRDLQCYLYDNWAASRQATNLGFRCCAD